MGVLDWQIDEGTGDVSPHAEGPVERTGFFDNIGAGYREAIAGPGSTRNRQNAAEARYYDTIIQALTAEGEMGEDKITVRPGGIGFRGPKDVSVNQFGIGFVGKRRPFKNPYTDAPSLSQDDNPVARLYLGGNRIEASAIWDAVKRVRSRKPDFLKDFPDESALIARADKDRQSRFAAAQAVTSRAGKLGKVGEFVGNIAGSIVAGDPENFVGAGAGGQAGKTIARTIIRRGLTEGTVNAAAGVVGLPGQNADQTEHLGMEEMTGKQAGRSILEQFAIGAAFGTAAEVAPVAGAKAKELGGKIVDSAAANAPAPVRDALVAASLRAGTVRDRSLLTEWRRQRSPYAVTGDTSTPDERAAAHVAEHDIEVREASPLDPKADGENNDRLSAIAQSLGVSLKAPDVPSPAPVQTPTVRDQSAAPTPTRAASYEEAIHRAEGTGKNPNSSASGHFQFTKGTWLEYAPRVADTADMSERQILALRNDRSVAEKAERLFRADNASYLRARGLEDSPGNLSLAHFLGKHDAAKVLKAAPGTPVEQLVDPASLRANRSVLEGKSAAEVVAWAHKRIGATVDGPVARPDAVPDFDPLDAIEYADVRPYGTATFRPDEVETDASLMQYKSGGDEFGVTDKLKNVTAWNPMVSSEILVWEANDGRRIVVDGHQRTGLAKRLSTMDDSIRLPAIVIREADGITAQQARVLGALRNIALGTGSLLDNARVLRDAPNGGRMIEGAEHRRDIEGLAALSHETFGSVLNGVIDPRIAAKIGNIAGDAPDTHMSLADLLLKERIHSPAEAETIVRQARADGFGSAEADQLGLFGAERAQSLYVPITRILAAAEKRLREDKRTFRVLSDRAGKIEAAGNVLDRTANEERVIGSDEALAILSATAHSSGPVRDALIAAARAELSGARRGDAVGQFLDALADIDLRAAAAGVGRDDGAGAASRGSGSEDAAAAPDRELPDSLEPSLFDQAVATAEKAEAFNNPVGPEAQAHTAALEHDVLMDAAADPATAPIYFHGSPEKGLQKFVSEVSLGKGGNHGIYFTADEGYAKRYAAKNDAKGEVYRVRLKIENPFMVEEGKMGEEGYSSAFVDAEMFKELRDKGHDAIINPNLGEVVVFSPEQVELVYPPPALFAMQETGFRLDEEGDARPIADIMKDAEADELAAEAMRACLQPPKVTE